MTGKDRNGRTTVYIGLGGNLGDPAATIKSAIASLRDLPETTYDRCSSLYRSAPVGVSDQPDFINAVCRVYTRLEANLLMQQLLEIERLHKRERRGPRGGPRTLDLDLLLYGTDIIEGQNLVVPHPRLHERAFVLYPLSELDPGVSIPGQSGLEILLQACAEQQIERLPDKL